MAESAENRGKTPFPARQLVINLLIGAGIIVLWCAWSLFIAIAVYHGFQH